MEELTSIYRVNFDYELELFKNKLDHKINEVFEHLFFYCCDRSEILFSQKKYSDEYLEFIKAATGFRNKIVGTGVPKNWWGSLSNLDKEKEINSKLTSVEISNLLNCNSSKAEIITSYQELEKYSEKAFPLMTRSPFERSGRENKILRTTDDLKKDKKNLSRLLEKYPLIVEEYQEQRDFDLGSSFKEEDGKFKLSFQIKNFNDKKGVFRGGLLLKEEKESPELQKIADEYYKRGAREEIQIDSFRFNKKWNWLCEANYRKTMGTIIKKLSRLCPSNNEVALLVTPKSWLKNYKSQTELNHSLENLEGVFPLSPFDSPISFWLFTAPRKEELSNLALLWWSIVATKEREFPEVYEHFVGD